MTLGLTTVGAGGIGTQHVAAAMALTRDCILTHVCDLTPLLWGPLADSCRVFATADLDAVLADPRVDVAHICLPPMLCVKVAQKTLAAGKHVICEKPFAGSLLRRPLTFPKS